MRVASPGRLWFTLFLLVATFSSNPFGSMEQGAPEANRSVVSADAVPAARLTAERDAVESAVEPRQPNARDFPQQFAFPLFPAGLPAPGGRAVTKCGPNRAGSDNAIPLCERLPYDANAPPVTA